MIRSSGRVNDLSRLMHRQFSRSRLSFRLNVDLMTLRIGCNSRNKNCGKVVQRSFSTSSGDDDDLPYHEIMRMPSLSKAYNAFTKEGVVSKWNFDVGEEFSAGNSLGEIETDQGTFEIDAQEDGFVAKHLVPAGSDNAPVKVGVPILVYVDDEEDVGVFKDFVPPPDDY